jgi:hypothetical protein
LPAQDTLLAGFSFSQFLGEGYPAIDGQTGDPVDHIVATYRGDTVPLTEVVDGAYIGNNGLPGYDDDAIGSWSFANFDYSNAVGVRADTFGAVNRANSTTVNGIDMAITDQASMLLTFNTLNTAWSIQVNDTLGYVNAAGADFTFAARGNGGTAIVEWLFNGSVFATSTITADGFNTYSYELPGGFYETGRIRGRLISGSVSFDNVHFNGAPGQPPSLTQQPAGQTVTAGANVTFTVSVTGAPSPGYRWSKNGIPLNDGNGIIGSTTATLSLENVSPDASGTYTVVVSNNGVTAESDPATLVVQTIPTLVRQPASTSANPGQTVVFDVEVAGFPAPALQWEKEGIPLVDGPGISGSTTAVLTLTAVTVDAAGDYRLIATNPAGDIASDIATLTLTEDSVAPTIATPPASLVVITGQNATFQVTATGAPAPTYQWRFNGEDLVDGPTVSGATTRTLTLTDTSPDVAGNYTVIVTNSAGTADATATLVVQVPPSIPGPSQPMSQSVVAGAIVTFSVSANGDPAPTYQWKKDGEPIVGETGATLTLSDVRLIDAGSYTVVVTNAAGSIESQAGILTVSSPPRIGTPPLGQTVAGGATVVFTVVADGTPEPSYQWLKDGEEIENATDTSYSINAVTTADAGRYTVRVQNSAGAVTSPAAILRVTQAVTVTTPSKTQVYAPGSLLSLGQLTSAGSVRYQWYLNGKLIPGAISPLYVIENAQTAHSGAYTLKVFNSAGRLVASRTIARIAVTVANTYDALLRDPVSFEPVGRVEILLTGTGAYSGRLLFEDGGNYAVKGKFTLDGTGYRGTALASIKRAKGRAPLELDLAFDAREAELTAAVSIVDDPEVLGAGVGAPRATAAAWQGRYKLKLKPTDSSEDTINATAIINSKGVLQLSGRAPDGRVFKASIPSSVDGAYAIFIQLYGTAGGHLAGSLNLVEIEGEYRATFASSGLFTWFKPAGTRPARPEIDLTFKPTLAP